MIPTIAESKRKIRDMGWLCDHYWNNDGMDGETYSVLVILFYPQRKWDEHIMKTKTWWVKGKQTQMYFMRQAYVELADFLEKYCKKVEAEG